VSHYYNSNSGRHSLSYLLQLLLGTSNIFSASKIFVVESTQFLLDGKKTGKNIANLTQTKTSHKIDAIVRTVSFNRVSCFSYDILKSHDVALEADGMVTD